MLLHHSLYTLKLRHTFTIARGSSDERPSIQVELEHNGIIGRGEAAPIMRYSEDPTSVTAFLNRVDLTSVDSPEQMALALAAIDAIAPSNYAAKAAIDIALHDWNAQRAGLPLWKYLGHNPSPVPPTSFTIGIDSPDVVKQKVREAGAYPVLKVKVGTEHDEMMMKTIRNVTDKPIRADANEGWINRDEAARRIEWLSRHGVEFVEQPMPADKIQDVHWLHERSALPMIADESCGRNSDIADLVGAFDGINIKLMKCGGIAEARRMIKTARTLNLKLMLGCMIETSVAIAAAAHLSPLVDYIDLDGALLTSNDPYSGLEFHDAKPILTDLPGLGLMPR